MEDPRRGIRRSAILGDTGATEFYVTGGTLRPDAPSYAERQADHDLYETLRAGEFAYVLTSRQMGKSSLMARAAARLRQDDARVVVLDLTAFGQGLRSSASSASPHRPT